MDLVALAIVDYSLRLSCYSSNQLIKRLWNIQIGMPFFGNRVIITVLLGCLANLYSSMLQICILMQLTYLFNIVVKAEGKVVPMHTMKAHGGAQE
jgi:uncharacterized membrane protein